MNPEALAQSTYERLAEDESLRGDLSDAGFGPLLDWAANQAVQLASSASDPQAFAQRSEALRTLIRNLVQTASSGDVSGVADLIEPVFGKDEAAKSASRFAKLVLGQDPDENAQMLLTALPT
jgi:hypothetical protein